MLPGARLQFEVIDEEGRVDERPKGSRTRPKNVNCARAAGLPYAHWRLELPFFPVTKTEI